MSIEKTTIQNDMLTFTKVSTPPVMPKKEIDKLAKAWIELVLDQLQHNCLLSKQNLSRTVKGDGHL